MSCCCTGLLVKPVIAADGHTCEKSGMEQWLKEHVSSPVTGAKLAHALLAPNSVLHSIMANSAHLGLCPAHAGCHDIFSSAMPSQE